MQPRASQKLRIRTGSCSRTLSLVLGVSACTGQLGQPDAPGAGRPGSGTVAGESPTGPGGQALLGRTGPRRMTGLEYDNTVRDLLGTSLKPASSFVAEEGAGFDNVASALGMTPSQYESYFNAAETLAAELFADSARRSERFPCTPSGADGGACLGTILADFGTRAFRRPLDSDELAKLRAAYGRAHELGESADGALQHVLVSMLASPQFLYRVELSQNPRPGITRPLSGYELASRLSYFLWSTMPDAELLRLAADGSLIETDTLRDQLARMLADEQAESLVDNFAGQWLGLRELSQHKVLTDSFPEFDDALRASMIEETRAYVSEFLFEERPLDDFLRAPLHFVDARLAKHYGIKAPAGTGFVKVEEPVGQRRGFLGLASFLTVSSFAHRTSPTLRAKWVLEELLCSSVPPPPANVVATLEDANLANEAAKIENVRERLALHRSDPTCAVCHARMDPIGLGLESFDGIGRSRERYANGDLIDTRGELPDGTSFDGPVELSEVLANDPRFMRCATEKLLTYAHARDFHKEQEQVEATLAAFQSKGTLRAAIETIVLSEDFRKSMSDGSEP